MKLEPARIALSVIMVTIGTAHFIFTDAFASIVPDYLPWHVELALISGVFEIALGVALLIERTRVLAAYGLVALFLAVFPANINMALHPDLPVAGVAFTPSPLMLWLRLPFQFVLIWWALRYARRKGDQLTSPSPLASSST